jgi:hypothetical protein
MASSKNSYGWTTPDNTAQMASMQNMQADLSALKPSTSASGGGQDWGQSSQSSTPDFGQSGGQSWQDAAMSQYDQAAATGRPGMPTRDEWSRQIRDYGQMQQVGSAAVGAEDWSPTTQRPQEMNPGGPDYGSNLVNTNLYSGSPRMGGTSYTQQQQPNPQYSLSLNGINQNGSGGSTGGGGGSTSGGQDLRYGWSQFAQPTLGLDSGNVYDQLPDKYNAGTDKNYRGNINSWGENWFWPAVEFNRADRNDLLNYGISLGNLNEQSRANMAREAVESGQLSLAELQWLGEGGAIDQAYAGLDVQSQGQNQNYALGLAGLEESGRVANMSDKTTRDLGFGQLNLQQLESDRAYELNTMGMDQAERKLAGDLSAQLHQMGIDDRGMTLAEMQQAKDEAFRYAELGQQGGLAGRGLDIEQQLANQGDTQFYARLGEEGRQFNVGAGFEGRRVGMEENMNAAQIADMLHSQGIDTRGMDLAELTQAQDFALGNRGLDIQSTQVGNDFTLGMRGLDVESQLGNRGYDVQSQLGNRGMDIESQLGNRGLDITSQKNQWDYALGNRGMDIQQQLADITANKSQAEIRQIDAQIGDMLFQQGIDGRRMTMEEKLAASTMADRLAKQGIDVRGMDLAELQRQDSMQEQMFRQGFSLRELQQQAQLTRESLASQERQAAMAAFGRDQGPNAQFLRNW